MNIQTGTIQTLTLVLTEPEARQFLVDPGPTQDAIRASLAVYHRAASRKEPSAAAKPPRSVGGQKRGRRPLAHPLPGNKLPCPLCQKPVTDSKSGRGTHFGKSHPGISHTELEWSVPGAP